MKATLTLIATLIAALTALYYEYEAAPKNQVLETPVQTNSSIQVFSEKNNAIFKSAYELLKRAESSILIINYAYDNDAILEVLNRKAKEGIDVTVVYDRGRSWDWLKKLNPAIKKITRKTGDGYVHHKMIVVDGQFVWFSSANFNAFQAKNIALEFQSPEMAKAIAFEMEAIGKGKRRINPKPFRAKIGNQEVELFFLPHNNPQEFQIVETAMNEIGRKKLFQLIDQSKTNIKVSIVVFTYKDLAKALVNAANRGVKVEVVTDSIDREVEKILKQGHIPIIKVKGPYHHKWMLVDDTTLWMGSANWSMSAFTRTDDSFIVLHNLTSDQIQFLKNTWKQLRYIGQKGLKHPFTPKQLIAIYRSK